MSVNIVSKAFFKTRCRLCRCMFTYEFKDTTGYMSDGIRVYAVDCPNCEADNRHDIKSLVAFDEEVK